MSVRLFARTAQRIMLVLVVVTGSAKATLANALPTDSTGIVRHLQEYLASARPAPAEPAPTHAPKPTGEIEALYRSRGFKPVWLAEGKPTARATALRAVLEASADEGLPPARYRVAELARLWRKPDDANRARLELMLTEGLALYLEDLTRGRADLRALEQPSSRGQSTDRQVLQASLQKALDAPQLEPLLRQLAPRDTEYSQLRAALHDYRQIARQGGWTSLSPGPMLKPGMSDGRVPAIRKRLAITGDFSGANPASTVYDADLGQAVRRFQGRHALPREGFVGAATIAAMNVPVEERIRQIAVNMERLRWSPTRATGKQIVVNIPGFDLVALRDARTELEMPVVVGKAYQQTPVFDEQMEYLEFNPGWLVPPGLAASEYLPELRQDPASLTRKHIRIFQGLAKDAPEVDPRSVDWNALTPATMIRYAFRQDPGPWNALGRMKFMFPNPYNVYLHDTSEPRFFGERLRTFSHGCIRLSRPEELAVWVLEDLVPRWDLARIRATVAAGSPATVHLPKAIPVRLAYRTAVFKGDSLLHFLPDIYGRDGVLERALPGEETGAGAAAGGAGQTAQRPAGEPSPVLSRPGPGQSESPRRPHRPEPASTHLPSRSAAPSAPQR